MRWLPFLLMLAPAVASAEPWPYARDTDVEGLLGRPVRRGGFHFQITFGIGGGPDTVGLSHTMEIGGTMGNGVTLGLLHHFIQNKGIWGDRGGPDLIGGWMFEVKVPTLAPEFVAKIAVGPGGVHEQGGGKIKARWGPAWAYGLDFHVPVVRGSGPTLSLTGLQTVVEGKHHIGFSAGLGYTVF
jgi:hypothetical protein